MCRQNAPLFDDFSFAGHLKNGHLLSICMSLYLNMTNAPIQIWGKYYQYALQILDFTLNVRPMHFEVQWHPPPPPHPIRSGVPPPPPGLCNAIQDFNG